MLKARLEEDNLSLAGISPHLFLYGQAMLDFGLTYVSDKEKANHKISQFLGGSEGKVIEVWTKVKQKSGFSLDSRQTASPFCSVEEYGDVIEEVAALLFTDLQIKQIKLNKELEFLAINIPVLGELTAIQKLYVLDNLNQNFGKKAYYTDVPFQTIFSPSIALSELNLDPFEVSDLLLEKQVEMVQMCVIQDIDDLIRYELLHLITNNYTFQKCQHCGFFFVPIGRADSKYCDRIMWGETKPCCKIGASRKNKSKVAGDHLLVKSQRIYKRMHNRLDRNKHNMRMKDEFRKLSDQLTVHKTAYLNGTLSAEDFEAYLEKL